MQSDISTRTSCNALISPATCPCCQPLTLAGTVALSPCQLMASPRCSLLEVIGQQHNICHFKKKRFKGIQVPRICFNKQKEKRSEFLFPKPAAQSNRHSPTFPQKCLLMHQIGVQIGNLTLLNRFGPISVIQVGAGALKTPIGPQTHPRCRSKHFRGIIRQF